MHNELVLNDGLSGFVNDEDEPIQFLSEDTVIRDYIRAPAKYPDTDY